MSRNLSNLLCAPGAPRTTWKYSPETASFCLWLLTAFFREDCFREDFLIRQHVWTTSFFLLCHGCNSHMWLTWAKENWRQIGILQLEWWVKSRPQARLPSAPKQWKSDAHVKIKPLSLLSVLDLHWECSNIKASVSVHWWAQCHEEWTRGNRKVQHLQELNPCCPTDFD